MSKTLDEFLKTNSLESIHSQDKDGKTVLHLLAKDNNARLLNEAIAAGANVNAEDNQGRTPLQDAIGNKDAAVDALLDHKAKMYFPLSKFHINMYEKHKQKMAKQQTTAETQLASAISHIDQIFNGKYYEPLKQACIGWGTESIQSGRLSDIDVNKIITPKILDPFKTTILEMLVDLLDKGKDFVSSPNDVAFNAQDRCCILYQHLMMAKIKLKAAMGNLNKSLRARSMAGIKRVAETQTDKINTLLEKGLAALKKVLRDFTNEYDLFVQQDEQSLQINQFWQTYIRGKLTHCEAMISSVFSELEAQCKRSRIIPESFQTLLNIQDSHKNKVLDLAREIFHEVETQFQDQAQADLSSLQIGYISECYRCEMVVKAQLTYDRARAANMIDSAEFFSLMQMPPQFQTQYVTEINKTCDAYDDSFEKAKRSEKAFEKTRREQAADAKKMEEKRQEETKHLAAMKRAKNLEIKTYQASVLKSIQELKGNNLQLFDSILRGTDLHDKIESSDFAKLISCLPPFSMKDTAQGAILYFVDKPFTSLHREHNGKNMHGAVIKDFVAKLTYLDITADTLPKLMQEVSEKSKVTNKG